MRKALHRSIIGAVALCAILIGSALLAGCSSPQDDAPSAPGSDEQGAQERFSSEIDADTLLAFSANTTAALFDEQRDDQANANPCFSPLSLYLATSLATLGSDGEAREELLEVLGMEDLPALASFCQQLAGLERADEEGMVLRIADSLWIDEEYAFRDSYLQAAEDALDASLLTVDFASPDADARIDEWVSGETNGLVQKGIQTTPETIAALVSALYLKDGWLEPFDPDQTSTLPFASPNGAIEAPFLNASIDETPYLDTPAYTAAALETQGGARVAFFLPKGDASPASLLAEPSRLLEMLSSSLEPRNVTWSVPAFTASSTLDSLQDVLVSLGVRAAFDPERTGSFTSMIETEDADFYVNRIAQGNEVSLNAFGIEAASATIVEMMKVTSLVDPSEPIPFVLDRPFAFVISSPEGHPLFIGTVNDPLA